MKDYFSTQSKIYATFRPTYPVELYDFIFQHLSQKKSAWDCATGNGQVASYLAEYFKDVFATDISQQQLDHAVQKGNIHYTRTSSEQTSFEEGQFDLITVAQALHWFDQQAFYQEVKRVAKPDAILAVWGYGLLRIEPTIDHLITGFYQDTVGSYWDRARKLVEDEYRSILFPFDIIRTPEFFIRVPWNIEQLAGYLLSWSATQKFIKENGYDPVLPFLKSVEKYWTSPFMPVVFPIFSRVGRVW